MMTTTIAGLLVGALGGYLLGARRTPAEGPASHRKPRADGSPPTEIVPTVDEEVARAISQGAPVTLFYLAWQAMDPADPALRLIESLLVRLLRPYDAIVPLGEGRFILVLPQVGEASADTVANRLLQELGLLATVHLTASESVLPRVTLAAPCGVKALLDAAFEAAELAPPMRGDRGQFLYLGMAVMERSEVSLMGELPSGVSLRLEGDGLQASVPVQCLDATGLVVKPPEAVTLPAGARVSLIKEEGQALLRGSLETVVETEQGLRLARPTRVLRVPRRRTERFRLRLPVRLDGNDGVTCDLSVEGFQALFPEGTLPAGRTYEGEMGPPHERFKIRVEVVESRLGSDAREVVLGCRFLSLDSVAHQALFRLLSRQRESGASC